MAKWAVVLAVDPPMKVEVEAEGVEFNPNLSRAALFTDSRHEVVALFSDWLYIKKV